MASANSCSLSSPLAWRAKTGHTDKEVDISKETPLVAANKVMWEGKEVGRFARGDILSIIVYSVTWGRPWLWRYTKCPS